MNLFQAHLLDEKGASNANNHQDVRAPTGWPPEVLYIPVMDIENGDVDPNLRQRMRKLLNSYKKQVQLPASKNVKIKMINDPAHPACGQRGLFAARRLEPREWIIDYAGELLPDDHEQLKTSDYSLRFLERHSIDGSKVGNEARFTNDFRGVPNAERPNIEFSQFDEGKKSGVITVLGFRVMHKPIKRGEELLTSYGKGFWQKRGLMPSDSCTSTCPGRHGLEPFTVPEGASYLCFPCSMPVGENTVGFQFCARCNYGVCGACHTPDGETSEQAIDAGKEHEPKADEDAEARQEDIWQMETGDHLPNNICGKYAAAYIANNFVKIGELLAEDVAFSSPVGDCVGSNKTLQALRMTRGRMAKEVQPSVPQATGPASSEVRLDFLNGAGKAIALIDAVVVQHKAITHISRRRAS
jgi:hypothetical protein